MGVGNLFVLCQVTIYFIALILSFFILVPVAVNKQQFSGHCLLYSTGEWTYDNKTGEDALDVHWGDVGYCNFPIFMSVLMFPIAVYYLISLSIHLFKNTEPSWVSNFVAVILGWLVTALSLVSGIIVTDGYNKWCSLLERDGIGCGFGEFVVFEIEKDINKKDFNVEYGMAKFGIWCAWICWLVLSVMASYRLHTLHQQEDFFTSMRRERQRLIQRVSTSGSREALYT